VIDFKHIFDNNENIKNTLSLSSIINSLIRYRQSSQTCSDWF